MGERERPCPVCAESQREPCLYRQCPWGKLPAGAARALPRLSREWQYPGRATFNAAGAFHLTTLGLAEQEIVGGRYRYRLTEAGAARQAAEVAHG